MNIHIRHEGKSDEIELRELGYDEMPGKSELKDALARYYDRSSGAFAEMVVEVQPNGNVVVRPEATFG